MKKPKMGETLFLVYYPTTQSDTEYHEAEVIKIGRKYFTVEFGYRTAQFNISNWNEKSIYDNRDSRYALFESKQHYLKENKNPNHHMQWTWR